MLFFSGWKKKISKAFVSRPLDSPNGQLRGANSSSTSLAGVSFLSERVAPTSGFEASTKVVSKGNTFSIGGTSNQNSFHYGPNIYIGRQAEPHALDPIIEGLIRSHNAEYDMIANTTRGPCTPQTRTEILQKLMNWGNSGDVMLYWMSGMAGTGKTTITYSLCQMLAESNILGASFFCSRTLPDCRNVNIIIPTIAFQLARRYAPFGKALAAALRNDTDILRRGLDVQLRKLIIEPWAAKKRQLPPCAVVVIEALDECDDYHARFLQVIFNHVAILPIKVLMTSRPELSIRDAMKAKDPNILSTFILHEVEHDMVRADIARYLESQLADRASSAVIGYLTNLSGILFIFAATLVRFLTAWNANFATRLELLKKSLPPDTKMKMMATLDALYRGVLSAAFHSELMESEAQGIREVLFMIVCARDPLTREGIAILWNVAEEEVERRLDSLHSVIFIPHDRKHPFTVFHASFPDFMQDSTRSEQFCCQPRVFNLAIAKQCLALMNSELRMNLCRLVGRPPNDLISPHVIHKHITHGLRYATVYWSEHWALSGDSERQAVANPIHDFLTVHILHWFECLSLCRMLSVSIPSLEALLDGFDEHADLANTVQTCLRFIQYTYDCIYHNAMETYFSALTWIPLHSPLRVHYATLCEQVPQVLCGLATNWTGPSQTINVHSDSVKCIAVSQDGRWIISGTNDGSVCIWDAHSPAEECVLQHVVSKRSTLNTTPCAVNSVAVSGDGSYAISRSNNSAQIWNTVTKEVTFTLEASAGVSTVAVSPDGGWVATGHANRYIYIWNAATGCLVNSLEGHAGGIRSVSFMSDSIQLISASNDWTARVWNAMTGKARSTLRGHKGPVWSVACSKVGDQIITGSRDKTARLWGTSGRALQILEGHSSWVLCVAFMPDGKQAITASDDTTLRIWDVTSGNTVRVFKELGQSAQSFAIFPNGLKIALSSSKTISIWSLRDGAPAGGEDGKVDTPPGVEAESMAFSPDGKKVLLLPSLRILDTATLRASTTLRSKPREYKHGAWTVSGRKVAAATEQEIYVWDNTIGRHVTLEGFIWQIRSIAFSHNESRLVSACKGNVAQIWSVFTRKEIRSLNHSGTVYTATFSRSGDKIISATEDAVYIWDARSGKQLNNYRINAFSAAFTPDSQYIITSFNSSTELRCAEAKLMHTYEGYKHWTMLANGSTYALSDDGQWICYSRHFSQQPRKLVWIPSQYRPVLPTSPPPAPFVSGPLFTPSPQGVQVCLPRRDGLVTLVISHH